MSALDRVGPAPETRSPHFLLLLFGASAAPIFWLGQLILAYAVTAYACYPGRYPQALPTGSALQGAMILFDLVAVTGAAAGGVVAFRCRRQARRHSRDHFLSVWGVFSSLCFLIAILFNVISSLTVPPCLI